MPITLTAQAEFRAVQKRTFCYLCANVFEAGEARNRDHVPPSTLFATPDRQPALILPTHPGCNHNRSAEDEVVGQVVGVLHGRPVAEQGRRPRFVAGSFPDGTRGVGSNLAMKPIIFRWVCGFHAALYNEPMGPSGYMVSLPLPEGRMTDEHVEPLPVPDVVPHLVAELKRNRLTGTLDVVICCSGQCRYECVWSQADNGRRICIWGLDVYGWKLLGDVAHFEPRGCVGVYWPNSGLIPSTATRGTRLHFAVPRLDRLDPFGN